VANVLYLPQSIINGFRTRTAMHLNATEYYKWFPHKDSYAVIITVKVPWPSNVVTKNFIRASAQS